MSPEEEVYWGWFTFWAFWAFVSATAIAIAVRAEVALGGLVLGSLLGGDFAGSRPLLVEAAVR